MRSLETVTALDVESVRVNYTRLYCKIINFAMPGNNISGRRLRRLSRRSYCPRKTYGFAAVVGGIANNVLFAIEDSISVISYNALDYCTDDSNNNHIRVLLIGLTVVFSLHIHYTDRLSVKPGEICSKNNYFVFLCFIRT